MVFCPPVLGPKSLLRRPGDAGDDIEDVGELGVGEGGSCEGVIEKGSKGVSECGG